MKKDVFIDRHIGPRNSDTKKMLQVIGVKSVDELIEKTIPDGIRLKSPLTVQEGLSEYSYLKMLRSVANKNQVFQSYIGLGYYGTVLPAAIQRNIFENPGWYTAYTPYQAEIAQGRLEALLNFQTMVCDLTAMPVANASLLDEATAAAEAMAMLFSSRSRDEEKNGINVFLVSDQCFPQTIDVLKTRATPLGIKLEIGKADESFLNEKAFGLLIQYPDKNGEVKDFSSLVKKAKSLNIRVAVASDLLALALLTPPGEWNADVVFGNSQRFGVPMGYGGPHAAFFAAQEEYKRLFPGRIIGVSVDSQGNRALRMALQTREQHIRRDKATSNICTAQALLAIMASMYAVYHGPDGIKGIASQVHSKAVFLNHELKAFGFNSESKLFFDTIHISEVDTKALKKMAEEQRVNFRYEGNSVFISLDQTVDYCELDTILGIFAKLAGKSNGAMKNDKVDSSNAILGTFADRKSNYLQHPVFNSYQSESELMRYIKRLENKDLSLTHSMISLGSCTMKLNAAAEMLPLTWNEFANMHPFVPAEQAQGYHLVIKELNDDLCAVTGFAAMSFQPNSGAQGEYAGLLVIKAYHEANGNQHRNVALIPSSAHGTNPASAAMCGMKIIVVKCDENGNIDVADLKEKAEKNKENLSCLMVTYPSTHGVFEESITEITKIIHDNGGQVYMDGANMNAQVGLTSPGNIGADVCHLNLHKTFAIPHGGGGPGMGPIGVAKHLVPFLPSHPVINSGGEKGIHAVSAAPYGSALILLISYGYIKMLGAAGLKASTETAILNANYMKEKLKNHFPILYVGKNGMVAHEMILDCKEFKRTAGVEAGDIAKRLMDFGFHAPTVAFPVHDTLMVEPTESESMQELDRFCEAMIAIRNEIREIEEGKFDQDSNVIKNAPHTANMISADQWNYKYPRSKAAFPLDWVRDNKFWPSVAKVDNAHGDRNLICICPPIENYVEAEV